MDVLNRMMTREEESGLFEGFIVGRDNFSINISLCCFLSKKKKKKKIVGRDKTRVSILQFADDTIFFSKVSPEILHNHKLILLVFEQLSRLKINLGKNIFSAINVSQVLISRLATRLDCKVSE